LIEIKTKQEIEYMKEAGKILVACHKEIAKMIKPGITTMEIDSFVEKFLKEHNSTPEEKGYMGYPYAICASVNDEICHGFPTKKPLKEGDIVTIDMVVNLNGWLADSAWSYAVGKISKEAEDLMKVTKECLYKGIEKAVIGNHIGDIGHEIQTYAESLGYSVVRDYT
jgi:methionyl aminopeptidase